MTKQYTIKNEKVRWIDSSRLTRVLFEIYGNANLKGEGGNKKKIRATLDAQGDTPKTSTKTKYYTKEKCQLHLDSTPPPKKGNGGITINFKFFFFCWFRMKSYSQQKQIAFVYSPHIFYFWKYHTLISRIAETSFRSQWRGAKRLRPWITKKVSVSRVWVTLLSSNKRAGQPHYITKRAALPQQNTYIYYRSEKGEGENQL